MKKKVAVSLDLFGNFLFMNQRSKKFPQSVIVRGFEFLKASPLKKLTQNVGVNLFFPVNIIFYFKAKSKSLLAKLRRVS